jgi:DNA-binding response OmpR family regulator
MAGMILVVDDDRVYRLVMERVLRREGYAVATAVDGQNALEELNRCRPQLVLLDVQMPRLDGYQVCRHIKSQPETRSTPVVFVSGLSGSEDRNRGIQAGADDFLNKPVEFRELLGRVHSLIGNADSRGESC